MSSKEVLPVGCSRWHPRSRSSSWEGGGVCTPLPWTTQHIPRGLRRVGPGGTWLNLPASQLLRTDIQFWNSRQSLEGLSVRSVFFGVFQSFVVLLYILDNETNFVVQVSVFIGVLIDLWKITKVMDVRLDREHKVAGLFPRPTFKDKSTYVESSTKVYDDVSFPHSGPQGGFPSSTYSSGTRGWAVGGGTRASAC